LTHVWFQYCCVLFLWRSTKWKIMQNVSWNFLAFFLNPFPKFCTPLPQKYITIFCWYEKISVHNGSCTYQVRDLLIPMWVGVKTWISNGRSWNMAWHTMPHCILDMHNKLSYSASFAWNTHDTSTLSLSLAGAERVWLPAGWWKGLAFPVV